MKRMLLIFTLVFTLISLSSYAGEVKVAPAALQSFRSSFKTAAEVKWTRLSSYYKADFSFNGQYVSAYYDMEGYLVAMTRNISSLQLPVYLQAELKNNYEGFWISDLFEVANDEGTTYYITLENGDSKIVLESISDKQWRAYKKQDKS